MLRAAEHAAAGWPGDGLGFSQGIAFLLKARVFDQSCLYKRPLGTQYGTRALQVS